MKSASAGLDAHLQGEVTSLATCWKVKRTDGVSLQFTDHDVDLTVDISDGDGAQVYLSSGSYNRSAIKNDDTLSVDNLDITGVLDSATIDETELRRGLFDFAEVRIFMVNHQDLSQGILRMRKGWLGEVTVTPNGFFLAELRGLSQAFARNIGELYSPECRADLGDSRCKVPILPAEVQRSTAYAVGDFVRASNAAPPVDSFDFDDRIYECTTAGTTDVTQPTYNTAVSATTVDGTATFTARQAWSRAIEVTAVDVSEPRKKFTVTELTPNSGGATAGRDFFPDDSMNGGVVAWETGNNAGRAMEVRDFIADDGVTIEQVVEMFLDVTFDVAVGDRARVYRGCLKRSLLDCKAVFDNIENFRGEPYVPGQDQLFNYPDAKT